MSWTNLSFSSGEILTASKTNAMQENFTAVASQSTGAPGLTSVNQAWVVFSSNGYLMNSENVSSVTRTQLGEYKITWNKSFTESYGITFGHVTASAYSDPSVRTIRAFPKSASEVIVTYIAFNPSAVAKEDAMLSVQAWQV